MLLGHRYNTIKPRALSMRRDIFFCQPIFAQRTLPLRDPAIVLLTEREYDCEYLLSSAC
jgi:hypothetical protein